MRAPRSCSTDRACGGAVRAMGLRALTPQLPPITPSDIVLKSLNLKGSLIVRAAPGAKLGPHRRSPPTPTPHTHTPSPVVDVFIRLTIAHAHLRPPVIDDLSVVNDGHVTVPLTAEEMAGTAPEVLRIRGFKLERRGALVVELTAPGDYVLGDETAETLGRFETAA